MKSFLDMDGVTKLFSKHFKNFRLSMGFICFFSIIFLVYAMWEPNNVVGITFSVVGAIIFLLTSLSLISNKVLFAVFLSFFFVGRVQHRLTLPVILGLIFFVAITPVAIMKRMLNSKYHRDFFGKTSNWIKAEEALSDAKYERQY